VDVSDYKDGCIVGDSDDMEWNGMCWRMLNLERNGILGDVKLGTNMDIESIK
jgi:hypothetical protein